MKNIFAKLILISFLAIFSGGKAVAQIENNLSDTSVFVSEGTILYIANPEITSAPVIFVSKNTTLSGIAAFTKSLIIYEEKKTAVKSKILPVKKISFPEAIVSIEQEIITKLPFTGNDSKTKIIAGSGSIPVPLNTSSQVIVVNYHSDYILFGIASFRAFQRKGFVFLDIKKIFRNALFARPPTFS